MEIADHFPTTQFDNIGVDLSIGEHKDRVLNLQRAVWLETLGSLCGTVLFDGLVRKGTGKQGSVAIGHVQNVVVVPLKDNKWKTGPFSNVRHREISYTLEFDVHVIIHGLEGTGTKVTPPVIDIPKNTRW
jgi:hypothetical protein